MIIHIRRSGGLAGTDEALGTIDTRALPADEAARVTRTLDRLADVVARPGDYAGADTYRYDVEIRDGPGSERVLTVLHTGEPDTPLPRPLEELLKAV